MKNWKKAFREMVYKYNRECKPLKEVEKEFLDRIEFFFSELLKEMGKEEGKE